MRIAFDTNVLAYAEGVGDENHRTRSLNLLSTLPQDKIVIPAQCLGELYRVLTGKVHRNPKTTRKAILSWSDSYSIAESSWTAFQSALDISVDHSLQIWDALILAVCAENHCRLLLSEDMQDGFTWAGVTVVNPYAFNLHPLLSAMIKSPA